MTAVDCPRPSAAGPMPAPFSVTLRPLPVTHRHLVPASFVTELQSCVSRVAARSPAWQSSTILTSAPRSRFQTLRLRYGCRRRSSAGGARPRRISLRSRFAAAFAPQQRIAFRLADFTRVRACRAARGWLRCYRVFAVRTGSGSAGRDSGAACEPRDVSNRIDSYTYAPPQPRPPPRAGQRYEGTIASVVAGAMGEGCDECASCDGVQ